jgi:hypothetical protein
MKNMVHECKVNTREELLQRISDAARHVTNAGDLHTITCSLIK